MAAPVRFYFDFISPNAYLAWHRLRPVCERHGRAVEAVPVLFAALLSAHGQLGPAEVEPKRRWMVRNCLRKARAWGIPFAAPASHPFNPLLALRLATVPMEPARHHELIDTLFTATWARGIDVSDPQAIGAVLDAARFDAQALLRDAQASAVKQRLREQTEAALARGVFGVPTMVADDDLFFGCDDLPWLDEHLSGRDIDEEAAGWQHVRPSARRPR